MEAVSPFNYVHDPIYLEPSKWRWFLYGELVDRNILADTYGVSPDDLPLASGQDRNLLHPKATMAVDEDTPAAASSFSDNQELCYRFEFWTRDFVAVSSGDKLLEIKYNIDHTIPFFAYEDTTVPYELYQQGMSLNSSVFSDMIPVQKEYNRFMSLLSQTLERASKLKVLLPTGSVLDRSKIVDDGSGRSY